MSRPGREYEEAVYKFAKILDPTAEVIFNHSVPDRDTGEDRQCDVWINAKFCGHWPISILVSCKDHNRKLHVGDIGTFCSEIHSTGASTGVIYSRSGFAKPALAKARANGIACCRIYRHQPADIPISIWFDQYVCKPTVELIMETDLIHTDYKVWNDIFNVDMQGELGPSTVLDELSNTYDQGEEWSMRQREDFKGQTHRVFPQNWSSTLQITDDHGIEQIRVSIIGRWKVYRARVEAILLNGSYCVSNGSFMGDIIGPAIDTQGEHPGEAWSEVESADLLTTSNSIIFILSKPDVRKTLRLGFGAKPLYDSFT